MRANFSINLMTRGFFLPGLVLFMGLARAQDVPQTGDNSTNAWQQYDWLKPAEDQQRQAASGETFAALGGYRI